MATITGLTAERMLEIEGDSIIDGEIRNGELWLIKHDGEEINAGPVTGPAGPTGPVGPASVGAIPGEVKLWPGGVLPDLATYGKWVWADGNHYPNADHPKAAAHIAPKWRTFDGASDPGGSRFRVPDLRGLVAAGLDQMPAGSAVGRALRMTRSVAIILAEKSGKETHPLIVTELAKHGHGVSVSVSGSISGSTSPDGNHDHGPAAGDDFAQSNAANTNNTASGSGRQTVVGRTGRTSYGGYHAHSVSGSFSGSGSGSASDNGDGTAHENVQPTVFVPYIVYLDVV